LHFDSDDHPELHGWRGERRPADPPEELAALRAEVARLTEELARRSPPRRSSRKAARNAEILRLRAGDRGWWTYKRLAVRFGMTAEAVRKVVTRAAAREPDIS
jgi:hypothetical protein